MTNVDHVAALELLRDDGAISAKEFEDLKEEILTPDDAHSDQSEEEPTVTSATIGPPSGWEAIFGWRPAIRTALPPKYPMALFVITALLLMASMFGIISWLVSFLAVLAMTATLVEGGNKVTIGAGLGVGAIVIVGMLAAVAEPPSNSATPRTDQIPVAAQILSGSLGIRLDELADSWNALDVEPGITRGLTLSSEAGQYDSFIYRFGEWGRLAGAYDPATDAVYGLLATGQLSNEATSQLYLHLCYVLHPYSQACITSYFETGLDNTSLEEFGDTSHRSQWQIEDQTWLIEIEDNVLTIRALAADVS